MSSIHIVYWHPLEPIYSIILVKISRRKVIDKNNSSPVQGLDTPLKCLQRAIIDVTAPPPSLETQAALANAKKPGKQKAENDAEDLRNDKNDISDKDEDLDDSNETVCSICNRLWRDYTKKRNWLICDICDELICPVCMPKVTDLEQEFYCKSCTQ